jgi:hypothetical protein
MQQRHGSRIARGRTLQLVLFGQPFSVQGFTVRGRKIVEMDILADPARLRQLDLTILDN